MSKRQASLWVALCAAIAAACFAVAMVRAAVPSASSSVDIPITVPMTLPIAGSVKDDAGATWALNGSISGTFTGAVKVTKTEPEPPPIPVPPAGVVFGDVTDVHGAVLTQSSSGKLMVLKGSGFPTSAPNSFLRLSLAGKSMIVSAWTATAVDWAIPNSVSDPLTAPLTGVFEMWRQENGNWNLIGRGGRFTILPPPRPAGARRKR